MVGLAGAVIGYKIDDEGCFCFTRHQLTGGFPGKGRLKRGQTKFVGKCHTRSFNIEPSSNSGQL